MPSSLLSTLNQEQIKAVKHNEGALLIIAGAGTGKTTVITTKIAWLIEQKLARTEEILALTFTDKAAGEMEERVDKLLPYGVFDKWISTFHSFCDKILQNHALDIGLNSNYRLIGETESWLIIRQNLYSFHLDYYRPKGSPSKFIHALIKLFSRLKDENITPEEYLAYAEGLAANTDSAMADEAQTLDIKRIKETSEAYFQYQQMLLDKNFLDFGDLIFYTNKLFVQRPNILKRYQNQFKFILVDEFQDTNFAQYNLIKLLAGKQTQLTVVGDDDQAIYKFRGASISNILNFKNDFPKAKEMVLTKNYRSTQNILNTAYNFIQHNNPDRLEYQLNRPDAYYKNQTAIAVEKIDKKLIAQTEEQGIVATVSYQTGEEEVRGVIEKIKKLERDGGRYSDCAILVRANKIADPYIDAMEQARIPTIFISNTGLYKEPIIIDILSYIRVLYDPLDAPSIARILEMPVFGIPEEETLAIYTYTRKKSETLFETINSIRRITSLSKDTLNKIDAINSLLKKHRNTAKTAPARELIIRIISDIGYREYILTLDKTDPEKAARSVYAIQQLIKKIERYSKIYDDNTLHGFIEHINFEQEAGERGEFEQNFEMHGPDAVKVMSVHASKGLEFVYVFIPQMVEQRFPPQKRGELIELPDDLLKTREILPEGDADREEERRLFYVALTRAKKAVFASHAYNYGGKRIKKPSVFLYEAKLLEDTKSVQEKNFLVLVKEEKNTFSAAEKFFAETLPILAHSQKVKKFNYPIPEKFSFSQLTAFETCPLQYKYQFVIKIPQDKGRASFSFGKSIHNTLLELFKKIKNAIDSTKSQATLFSAPAGKISTKPVITLEEIYAFYDRFWIDEWYESKEDREKHYSAGKKILKEFYERHKDNWPNPLFLEQPFSFTIDDITIKGRIDRIDAIDNTNNPSKVEIIDYKTSHYKDKLTLKNKKQLLIYQLATEFQGLKPVELSYYYLDENRQDKFSFLGSEKDLEKTKKWIVETAHTIKKSDFPANPGPFTCGFCDFKKICPFSAV